MIDIINFSGDMFQLGFSKVYNANDFNIKLGKNNREIASDKNIDILLMPEIVSKGRNLVKCTALYTRTSRGISEKVYILACKTRPCLTC